MTTLASTEAMITAHIKMQREGKLPEPPRPQTMSEWADGQRVKVRQSRARLAIQGAPLIYKSAEEQRAENAPTPEWMAKHGSQVVRVNADNRLGAEKVHRVPTPVEKIANRVDFSVQQALERYLEDASESEKCTPTANWQATGGGGARLGGLGNISQYERDCHARSEWIDAHLPPKAHETALALVTGELRKPNDLRFTLEDFAATHILPGIRDQRKLWGAGAGALVMLADNLIFLYRLCPIKPRTVDEDRNLTWEAQKRALITWER